MATDAAFFAKRGFGSTMDFGHRPALIVVHIICGFTNADMPVGADLAGVRAIPLPPAVEFRSYVLGARQYPEGQLAKFFLNCLEKVWPLST